MRAGDLSGRGISVQSVEGLQQVGEHGSGKQEGGTGEARFDAQEADRGRGWEARCGSAHDRAQCLVKYVDVTLGGIHNGKEVVVDADRFQDLHKVEL